MERWYAQTLIISLSHTAGYRNDWRGELS